VSTAFVLPGWGTSSERVRPLCEALRELGVDARPWAYEPVGSIQRVAGVLAEAVALAAAHDGAGEAAGEVALIGHSLGGLIAASAVLEHQAPATTVTTINSPWRGTWAAWTAHPDDLLGRELRWGSDSLRSLRDGLATHLALPAGPRWSIMSAALDLAAPPSSALRTPDGDRLHKTLLGVSGHSVSLLHPKVIDAVSRHVVGSHR
jgi:pimeloyl-ACP methyl ester carboxylesterase